MTASTDRGGSARLVELSVLGEADGWRAAGFTVDGDAINLGPTTIRLIDEPDLGSDEDLDPASRRWSGIVAWTVAGLGLAVGRSLLDGLPTTVVGVSQPADENDGLPTTAKDAAPADPYPSNGPDHPNGTTGIDHVVVTTPDLERTIAAFEAAGLGCRRIRETTAASGTPLRQAFFRLGATIVEVVSGATGSGATADDAPATWFGLALDVDDLDQAAALLGDGLGRIKAAVQPGRRIATLRARRLGLSVATALMDDHGER